MARSTHNSDYRTFLHLLRELRHSSGLTQAELGERIMNTQAFVSKVERGERRVDVVEFVEFCEALSANAAEIFKRYLELRLAYVGKGKKLKKRSRK